MDWSGLVYQKYSPMEQSRTGAKEAVEVGAMSFDLIAREQYSGISYPRTCFSRTMSKAYRASSSDAS